jgi:hypothetical protein
LLDLSSNQFSGTLDDYAYQTDAQGNDEYSILRYLNVSNNELMGASTSPFPLALSLFPFLQGGYISVDSVA